VLGTVSGRGQYGTTLTLGNIAVTPGSTYYVKVQGADNSVFSTGDYALTLNLGTGANPTVPLPDTQTANGNPLSAGGGVPMEPATNPSSSAALYGTTIPCNLRNTSIPAGDTVWFSGTGQVSGLGSAPANVYLTNAWVTYTANGTTYYVPMPNSVITFSPTATTATTTFNAASGYWYSVVPSSFGDDVFLTGLAVPVPAGGVSGGLSFILQANITSDTPGLSVSWKWGAAVYSQFGTDYATLGVKPVTGSQANPYANTDVAGTAEAYRSFFVRSGNSGTSTFQPAVTADTASLSGTVVNEASGAGLAGAVVTLTGTTYSGQLVTLTTTTAANGSYSFTGLMPGTYSLIETPPLGYVDGQNLVGSLGGSQSLNQFSGIDVTAGVNGYQYGFENLLI
jgi:hypothetical protein